MKTRLQMLVEKDGVLGKVGLTGRSRLHISLWIRVSSEPIGRSNFLSGSYCLVLQAEQEARFLFRLNIVWFSPVEET